MTIDDLLTQAAEHAVWASACRAGGHLKIAELHDARAASFYYRAADKARVDWPEFSVWLGWLLAADAA